MQSHIDAAYGLEPLISGSLDTVHDLELSERFVSLWPGFDPRPPVAANLAGAMNHLVSQALDHEFPAAPAFEAEIKTTNLKKVLEVASEAARSADDRAAVDKALRPLIRGIANPLKLGEMVLDATHFVISQHWKNHFTRKVAETGGAGRGPPFPRMDRRTETHGASQGGPEPRRHRLRLADKSEFLLPRYGSRGDAEQPAGQLRGARGETPAPGSVEHRRGASGVDLRGRRLAASEREQRFVSRRRDQRRRAGEGRSSCQNYCLRLRDRIEKLGLTVGQSDRLNTATAIVRLLERIHQQPTTASLEPSVQPRSRPVPRPWENA